MSLPKNLLSLGLLVGLVACGGPKPVTEAPQNEDREIPQSVSPPLTEWQPFSADQSTDCVLPDMDQQPISDLEWGMFPEAVEAELGQPDQPLQTTVDNGGLMTWSLQQPDGINVEIRTGFEPETFALNLKFFSYTTPTGLVCAWTQQP